MKTWDFRGVSHCQGFRVELSHVRSAMVYRCLWPSRWRWQFAIDESHATTALALVVVVGSSQEDNKAPLSRAENGCSANGNKPAQRQEFFLPAVSQSLVESQRMPNQRASLDGSHNLSRVVTDSPRGKETATWVHTRRLGSKANEATWKTIINQMPPHQTYLEPFLGWGAIMLHKAPANHSIVIDKEESKVKNFLLELATAHPTMGSGIVNVSDVLWSQNGHKRQIGRVDIASASPTCAAIVGDALSFLAGYPWRGDEMVYCDPPYLLQTRTSSHRYLFEMDEAEHIALLDIIRKIPANVMISGYYSKLYKRTLRKWRLVTFEAITRGGTMRTEHLWCNFPEPVELHDYQWVGDNFRQRQDLNRMRRRWVAKLGKMSVLNRQALFAAIQECYRNGNGETEGRCPCGCGLKLTGKKRYATGACRVRLLRQRKNSGTVTKEGNL